MRRSRRRRAAPAIVAAREKIAKEHNIDHLSDSRDRHRGTVTKDDILAFIGGSPPRARNVAASAGPLRGRSSAASGRGRLSRLAIASRRCRRCASGSPSTWWRAADVRARAFVFEVNFSRVAQIREAKKAEFERSGAKLTFLSFIVKAAVEALRAVPIVNASVDGDTVVYHKDVNVGIAVALDWGLIVR
jgi:2-oxoglutarate dehydrogenase E2 component (dihydrolipoamide succinyltransferase)